MQQTGKRTAAILGGEGFIGRNLAYSLSNHYECFSIGKEESSFLDRKDTFILANPYEEKINTEYAAIVHLIDNKHCASDDFLDEEKKLAENLALNDKNHLILFSSAVVYANPESDYGLRKRMLEKFYTEYCKKNNVLLTIVRLFNTFGSFQIPQNQGSLIANIIYNHVVGQPSEINSRHSKRDFLYAGDIPKFIEYFLEKRLTGTFDLGSGKLMAIGDVISILENKILETRLDIVDKNKEDSIVSPAAHNLFLDDILLTDLNEALTQTVDFYRNNIDIVKNYVH